MDFLTFQWITTVPLSPLKVLSLMNEFGLFWNVCLAFHGFMCQDRFRLTGTGMREWEDDMQQSATDRIRTTAARTKHLYVASVRSVPKECHLKKRVGGAYAIPWLICAFPLFPGNVMVSFIFLSCSKETSWHHLSSGSLVVGGFCVFGLFCSQGNLSRIWLLTLYKSVTYPGSVALCPCLCILSQVSLPIFMC